MSATATGATAGSTSDAIIAARGLTKSYKGRPAVRGIDLDIRHGEIFGILGPNGAGKTTTLEMIEGLRDPDSGTITVDGIDALAEPERVRQIIGVQLQSTSLFPFLTAGELIALFGAFYGAKDTGATVDRLLALVGLEDKRGARVDEMSGGQQQRLGIALALVNEPRVTFLDEPTTGLDPRARRTMWDTVLGIREAGTTVVLTTHYMEEAEVLCDRIAIMDAGRIIACDTPAGLIEGLKMEAVVSGTLVPKPGQTASPAGVPTGVPAAPAGGTALTEADLRALPAVGHATLTTDDANGDGHRVTLRSSDVQATIVALLGFASERGLTVANLGSTRASIEDVFLQLTGREYAAGDEPVDADAADTANEGETAIPPKRRGFRRKRSA